MLLFRVQTWAKAQLLLVGAILFPGKRTIAGACWSWVWPRIPLCQVSSPAQPGPLASPRIDQGAHLSPAAPFGPRLGPLVFGIDETLECCWGRHIRGRGNSRDSVWSSASHFVKASGLCCVSLMWLSFIPWAHWVWVLPVLTALAPSERYHSAGDGVPSISPTGPGN